MKKIWIVVVLVLIYLINSTFAESKNGANLENEEKSFINSQIYKMHDTVKKNWKKSISQILSKLKQEEENLRKEKKIWWC